jgi:sterol desaturase/sphingolipid hydroxylase (fatty acid hydroxylase superfamily)
LLGRLESLKSLSGGHANVLWTINPEHHIIKTPVSYRSHHNPLQEARDKNFASPFPVFNLLFGTFSIPACNLPMEFGVHDDSCRKVSWFSCGIRSGVLLG